VYRRMGDPENALFLLQKALEIRTRVVGSEHTRVAASKLNIGLVFKAMGKMSEAKQMFTGAAGIDRKV
jgi:hypothetical protein